MRVSAGHGDRQLSRRDGVRSIRLAWVWLSILRRSCMAEIGVWMRSDQESEIGADIISMWPGVGYGHPTL